MEESATTTTTQTSPVGDYPVMVAAWVADTIPQLEAAIHGGTLADLIERPEVQEIIGPKLVAGYRRIATEKLKPAPISRSSWALRFVQVFQQSLQAPRRLFSAKTFAGRTTVKSPRLPLLEIDHEDGVAVLRPDQVVSARYWGIWFSFDYELVERLYLDFLISSSRHLLVSSIELLRQTLQLLPNGCIPELAHQTIGPETSSQWNLDVHFEHLIMDVLNEFAPLAAPIAPAGAGLSLTCSEDRALSGSRLAVSLAATNETQQQSGLQAARGFLLSPYELARCAMRPASRPQFADSAWNQLCASIVAGRQGTDALAQYVREHFIETLSTQPNHPLGPAWNLSVEMRRFIHAFVGFEPPKRVKCLPGPQDPPAGRMDPLQAWSRQCDAIRRRFPTLALPPETRSPQEYLPLAVASVKQVLHELEAAIHDESLVELIMREDVQNILGQLLVTRYRAIAVSRMRHDALFRKSWISKFVDAFERSLQSPSKLFRAKAASEHRWPERRTPPSLSVSHSEGVAALRPEQVLTARRWGIWFTFDDELLETHYTTFLMSMALQHLDSNIANLWNLEATYLSRNSNLTAEAEWHSEKRGVEFEHLIIDVLNEVASVARPAPLAEDILERTDVRVSYPGIKRKNGARVQISLASHPLVHDSKMRALVVPEEFILLTPLELARCAVHPPTDRLFDDFDWSQFWDSFGGHRRDVHALAQELHDIFIEALYRPLAHPLGPMWSLPSCVRQFIRTFTEHQAAKTTEQVRKRLQTSGKPMDAVHKYTSGFWKVRLSQARPAAQPLERQADPSQGKQSAG